MTREQELERMVEELEGKVEDLEYALSDATHEAQKMRDAMDEIFAIAKQF